MRSKETSGFNTMIFAAEIQCRAKHLLWKIRKIAAYHFEGDMRRSLIYLGKMNFRRELFYSCELAAVGEGDSFSVKAAVSAVGSTVVDSVTVGNDV